MAEAVAAIGLLASIASLIDVGLKVVSRMKEYAACTMGLPATFRSLDEQLPLLTSALQRIQIRAQAGHVAVSEAKRLGRTVETLLEQVKVLERRLECIAPKQKTSRLSRALHGIKSLSEDVKLRRAVEDIERGISILILYHQTMNSTGDVNCAISIPNHSWSRTLSPDRKVASRLLRMLSGDDYESVKASLTRRLDGTCEWFVQHPEYMRFRETRSDSLLWYSADPGCGKSIMARYLIDEMQPSSSCVLYFFFQRQVHASLAAALCALLHQLYRRMPHLLKYAERVYRSYDRHFVNEPASLWRLFRQSIADCDDEIVCVLDAVDECDTEGSKLLFQWLLEERRPASKCHGPVKFLITGRPYYYMQRHYRDVAASFLTFRIDGENESKLISRDIEIFIRQQVSRLDLGPQERSEVVDKLLQKQSDDQTFLWAFLITEQLCTEPLPTHIKLLASVDKLPLTVLDAYEAILRQCADIHKTRMILSIILAARRPLTLDQMDVILALEDSADLDLAGPERLVQAIRHACGLFVRIVDFRVYLIHRTARDFLLGGDVTISPTVSLGSQQVLWRHSVAMAQCHFQLVLACIRLFRLRDAVRPSSRHYTALKGCNVDTAADEQSSLKSFAAYAAANCTFHLTAMLQSAQVQHRLQSIQPLIGLGLDLQMADADGRTVLHHVIDVNQGKIDIPLVQLVLDQGGLADNADHMNMTCMHYAVLRCHQNLITILQKAGFDVNKRARRDTRWKSLTNPVSEDSINAIVTPDHQRGLTPLHAAAFFGREDIIPHLLTQGADVNAQDEYGRTPMHLLHSPQLSETRINDLWELEELMVGYVDEYEEEYADETLSNAREVRLSIGEMLCEDADINLDLVDEHGRTCLHYVQFCEEGSARTMVELLVRTGANVTAADDKGKTPIHVASKAGDVESLQIMVKINEDLEIPDKQGRNALHFAAQSGNGDAVSFIIRSVSSLSFAQSVDSDGRTALHHAVHSGSSLRIIPSIKVLEILIRAGVSVDHKDHAGLDPLAYYISHVRGRYDSAIIATLLAHGADPHFQDDQGLSLVHHLMRTRVPLEVTPLRCLELYGTDIHACDREGKNILHHAAISGSVSVGLLYHLSLCHQLDFNVQDDDGKTAVEYARELDDQPRSPHALFPARWKESIVAFEVINRLGPEHMCPCQTLP